MNKDLTINDAWSILHNACGSKISDQLNNTMIQNVRMYLMLDEKQIDLIRDIRIKGQLLRSLMDKQEIKIANQLVKKKFLTKGISDDKQKTVIFMVND